MIKNYNFNIAEEEKRQILSLHESRTKRHYLINEQSDVYNPTIEQAKLFVDKVNAYKAKNPNGAALQDAKLMNSYQIALNKISENPSKPVQSQQTQTNNNYYSKYVKQAQTALGVTVDGKFGPDTLKALNALVVKVKATAVPVTSGATQTQVTSGATSGETQTQVDKNNPLLIHPYGKKPEDLTASQNQKNLVLQGGKGESNASVAIPNKLAGNNSSINTTGGLKY
jgi:murein L,D-transpeptidase YcbB/YkuD